MTAKTFEEYWKFVFDRSQRGVLTVQDPVELKHIFELMRACDCQSYLEIGTAEGNSLYVLGHAVAKDPTDSEYSKSRRITYIDLDEEHTRAPRAEALSKLGKPCWSHFGDSTNPETHHKTWGDCKYDCILIDGGHDFATVLSDSILYAPLATKYVFWHDIQLPEVRAAYEWFKKRWALGEYSEFIASDSFGFGILKVKQ